MANDHDILIRISGETYRLQPDKPESIQKIPWAQRKRLIDVLEAIKKAEYVDSADSQESEPESSSQDIKPIKSEQKKAQENVSPPKSAAPDRPPADSDMLMQRLLAEQQGQRKKLPTKAGIYKWFLIIFAVIMLLILLF